MIFLGKRIVPKEIRDFNDTRNQLIDALNQKNELQENMIAAQEHLISELTEEVVALREQLKQMKEKN